MSSTAARPKLLLLRPEDRLTSWCWWVESPQARGERVLRENPVLTVLPVSLLAMTMLKKRR